MPINYEVKENTTQINREEKENTTPKKIELFVDGEGYVFMFIDGTFILRADCEYRLTKALLYELESNIVKYYNDEI